MFATRMMHEHGVTSEDFGRVAVADRRHAANNPAAQPTMRANAATSAAVVRKWASE